MASFDVWEIVKVPFPYADRPVRQRRPALVVAAAEIQQAHDLLWVLMVTSAAHRGWPDDVTVPASRADMSFIAPGVAGITVLSSLQHFVDESVLLGRQVDCTCGLRSNLVEIVEG